MTLLLAMPDSLTQDWRDALAGFDDIGTVAVLPKSAAHGAQMPPETLNTVKYAIVWGEEASPALMAPFPQLALIFSMGAGVDHLMDSPAIRDRLRHIPIVRVVHNDLTARMREHIVLQTLLHHRQILAYRQQQQRCKWAEIAQPRASDLRVGFLGFGVLARPAAAALGELGFQISAWSRSAKTETGIKCYSGSQRYEEFLAGTDILVNLLPLTEQTRRSVDRRTFAGLNQNGALGGPVFINAGRGGTVNEADLTTALQNGTLVAASLDVFAEEPLPATHPLWRMDNVVITPHIAAVSEPRELAPSIVAQIRRFESGLPPENVVDRAVGY